MRRQGLLLACHFFVTFAAVASLSAADILWTNSAGGNWHVAANWNPNQVPAAGDTAFITNRGDYTVILNADASVASLFLGGSEGGQAITIGGSTLTMNGPARINSNSLVAVTGGTIGGSGDLRVEGVLNFFGGSLLGSQPVVVAPSGQLLIGGSVNLGGRSVHNSGRMIWTSGNISNVSSVVNLPGGVIDALVSNDSVLTGRQVFTNGGTLRRSLGTNTVTFNMPFHNGGTAQIQSGRVLLNQEVLHTGTLIVAAGATLQVGVGLVSNPPADFSTGSFVTGAGHAILYNADIRGSFHVGGSNIFTGGTVNVMSGYVLSNAPLQILAGTVNFNSGRMLTPSAVTLTGGTLAGADSMSVTGSIRVVPGPVRLQSSGILNGNGGFTISGDLSIFSGTVNNGGASSVLSGALRLWSNSVFNNLPGATIHYAGASHIGEPEMPGTLNNHGLFVKTGGFKGIAARFNNHGEMDIQGGILFLSEGGSHSGSFRVGAGSTLRFDPGLLGAAHTLQESSQVTGDGNVGFGTSTDVRGSIAVAGDVSIVAGTNNFTGAFTNGGLLSISGGLATFSTGEPILPGSLSVSGGVLDGDDPITVRGPTSLTGGALSGSGAITANGGLTIGGTTLLLNGRTLNNRAYANWNGGFIFTGGGSVISNAAPGVFNINFDGQTFAGFGGNRRFVNAGVLRKSGGSGTAVISDAFFNMGTVESVSGGLAFGNVFMQTAGSTLLNGGNLGASGPLQIDGGVLAGSGNVSATVVNSGRVAPSGLSSLLRILGDYTQTSNGRLDLELGGTIPGSFAQVQIQGTASLAGTLNVSSMAGAFHPDIGDTFQVLTFASRTGDFSVFNDSTGSDLNRIYDGTSLTLAASNNAPVLVISQRASAVSATQPSEIVITWTDNAPGYLLQSATNIPSASWVTIPSGGTNRVVVPSSAPRRFFRLIKP